jgi:hypothetical protein
VGTLPRSWQSWGKFSQLDLSSNKFSGTLSDNFALNANFTSTSNSTTVLDLTVNRLSGKVPYTLRTAGNINVLDGNLFECDTDSLPESDPSRDGYVCGARDFNISLVSWCCVFAAAVLLAVNKLKMLEEWLSGFEDCASHSDGILAPHIKPSVFILMAFMTTVCSC